MLDVIGPAATTALTTLDRVKLSLGVTDDADDEYLEMMIAEQSDYVCGYLNVAMADDGTRTLGLETLEETMTYALAVAPPGRRDLAMEDGNGEVLDPADYSSIRSPGGSWGRDHALDEPRLQFHAAAHPAHRDLQGRLAAAGRRWPQSARVIESGCM